ncbi:MULTISPECIES: glycerophosphodiester phosphodiesterase family protein [unclassified Curtobacterium]|uniref:glycerophosphodiester phosphodiesterase family protein n=1 Tax=unclassified Curtobacterium TaxID=257496 RepID=UPI0008DE3035|nr:MULTISPECIES: glycerophosphodiester phosphodiesterase family protein [unclassified Curtobacterium]WIA96549.1 glycerophosphodiester phosphodiesterase family protein [Curtobacterium sp. MCBA15_004]WIA99856.1 glycerophosphodiester phosphodiesterase family protein [Curtobacterium sp. MCBA15_012]
MTQVIAHRGASGHRPEHSRAAYELAVELGADAIEPDLVPTKDGVLVLRHENEVSGTTDVAERPEFAHLRTTKTIDGQTVTGWFTEDMTWGEVRTLTVRERLPALRPASAAHDGEGHVLRLDDLLGVLDAAPRPVGLVAEVKHATFFEQAGFPMAELLDDALGAAGWRHDERLTIESFEKRVLRQLGSRDTGGRLVYLQEARGSAADEVASHGSAAPTWATERTDEALAGFASEFHGISVDLKTLMAGTDTVAVDDPRPVRSAIVDRAHAAGLAVYTWTLRPENRFLPAPLRRGGDVAAHGDWERWFTSVVRTGVDGVFADHPDLAVRARSLVAGQAG